MKFLITGHRIEKLSNYNTEWIKQSINNIINNEMPTISLAYSGMASGVDLWFCESCLNAKIPYYACVPFEGQELKMSKEDEQLRSELLKSAAQILKVRNSYMIEKCDSGIVVWDGNKGGTHNVLQQLVEAQKGFYWINPVNKKIWRCF